MLTRGLSLFAAVLLTAPTTPTFASQPVGDWKIEPSDARCVAVRQYGTPDQPVTLALKAPPTDSEILQVAIIRPGYRKSTDQSGASLMIDSREFDTYALGYPLGGEKKHTATLFNLTPDASNALRKASNLSISIKGGVREGFSLSPSANLWSELDACLRRVKTTWNIGEESSAKLAKRVGGSLRGIFTAADYPRDAMAANFAGSTSVLMLIDETGSVKDCTVLETSGMAVLDLKSCGVIMQRAKFAPAEGPDGKPVKDSYRQRINWSLKK